jgi:hypothetical protein
MECNLIRAIFGFTLKIGVVSDPSDNSPTHKVGRENMPFIF